MSEMPPTAPDDEPPADELRQHPEDPAEGVDPDDEQPDVPRVHPEDPAEG